MELAERAIDLWTLPMVVPPRVPTSLVIAPFSCNISMFLVAIFTALVSFLSPAREEMVDIDLSVDSLEKITE